MKYILLMPSLLLMLTVSTVTVYSGVDFDGEDDYISLTDYDISESLTISAWFLIDDLNRSGYQDWCTLASKNRYSSPGYNILINVAGTTIGACNFYINGASRAGKIVGGGINIWHHMTAVYDKTNETVIMYIDGEAGA